MPIRRALVPLAVLALTACNSSAEPAPQSTVASVQPPVSVPAVPRPAPTTAASPVTASAPVSSPAPEPAPPSTVEPAAATSLPAPSPMPTPTAPASSPAPTVVQPAPTPVETSEAPAPSAWRSLGAELAGPADVSEIGVAPAGFADYVRARFAGPDTDGCSLTSMSVQMAHPDGFVYGSEAGDCGGGAAVYASGADGWRILLPMQAMPLCSELTAAGVPAGLGILCGDGDSQREY